MEKPWEQIDYYVVREHSDRRFETHLELKRAFERNDIAGYVPLALGISNPRGNYSSAEHGLGPRILRSSKPERVFELASQLVACESPADIPVTIYRAKLPYLKISVGSEMSMMLRLHIFWVTNVRTVWAYLVIKHGGNRSLANEELKLYREHDAEAEMTYEIWREIHHLVGPSLATLGDLGAEESKKQNIEPGELKYLWADAVADRLYNECT